MPVYNGVGEFGLNQLLVKRLTTPGDAPAPAVAPELFPTMVLEADREEWGFLKGEMRYTATGGAAAVAAERSLCRLTNPVGSKVIAVIELVNVVSTGFVQIRRSPQVDPTLTAVGTLPWDTRRPFNTFNSILVVSFGSMVGTTPGSIAGWGFPSNSGLTPINQRLVMGPGTTVDLAVTADLTALTMASIMWRERGAQPGELV